MKIGGFQKISLSDYPGKIASVVFTQGCNLRCPFCHNPELIDVNEPGKFELSEIIGYLKNNRKFIEAVVISGGEPTIQEDIISFIRQIKSMRYLVKLDTNGTNPLILSKLLITERLIDYIAMDLKLDHRYIYNGVIAFDIIGEPQGKTNYPDECLKSIGLI